ncbi:MULTISPECIES: efflux RND transporter periplasmic adaptor subunit [unclassified Saccharicrinis]|uniref:efflux RND transporter periplasmic adaptor subunit n=1 Tax=unclassified Saccharicrinis TaxID=2646859 RepID=UPI003D34E434
MNNRINTLLFAIILLLTACKNQAVESDDNSGLELIEISKLQFQSENMELGSIESIPFADKLHFTGTVVSSPNGTAIISAPIAGTIKSIRVANGDQVKKGTPVIEISGLDIIDLQKDFAESAATLHRLTKEFERTSNLFQENIGAQKDFMQSESEYKVELARNNALKIKLENAGLNTTPIANGKFSASYTLKTPIDGYITQLNAVIGQFVEPQVALSEIVDQSTFRLSIPIFGKDIGKIFNGQRIEFNTTGSSRNAYYGKITHVGKTINSTTKAVECFANIENVTNMVNHQYVEGDIILTEDSALAINTSAVLNSDNDRFILLLHNETNESYSFKKVKVNIVRENNLYSELKEKINLSGKVLTKGAYNLTIE